MQKKDILKLAQSDEDRLCLSKVLDGVTLSDKYNSPRFTDFFDPRMTKLSTQAVRLFGGRAKIFGGYDGAERQMLGIYSTYEPESFDFPITALEISGYETEKLSHRDILGSLLALGIKREKIGDIFFNDKWFFFACNEISEYLVQNLERASRCFVTVKRIGISDINPPLREFKEIRGTVASARLDCVVALLIGKSRSIAVKNIVNGNVQVNYSINDSVSHIISDGDIITVKGFGKAVLNIGGKSRKDRIHITALKYI